MAEEVARMIPQGYPLWAVDEDGTAYAVVGWSEDRSIRRPVLVPLSGAVTPDWPRTPADRAVLRYTTTDPTKRPDVNALAYMAEDLRQRLAALADTLESHGEHDAARGIREELAK